MDLIKAGLMLFVSHAVYARFYMAWLRHGTLPYEEAALQRCLRLSAVMLLALLPALLPALPAPSKLVVMPMFVWLVIVWELVYMWVFSDDGHNPETLLKVKKK